jgi:dTDP-4-dehydrorhamnose reductase
MGIKDIRLFFKERCGIYHCAGSGYCSRYEWAKFILEYSGIRNVNVLPAKSNDFVVLAYRPYFSVLDINKFKNSFGLVLPDWKIKLKLSLL